MGAVTYHMQVEAGAGKTIEFRQRTTSGEPVAFAEGTTARFQVRSHPRAETAVLDLEPTVDEETGVVTLHLSDEDTRALDVAAVERWVYAIELAIPDSDTVRLVEGRIVCSPEVVRT